MYQQIVAAAVEKDSVKQAEIEFVQNIEDATAVEAQAIPTHKTSKIMLSKYRNSLFHIFPRGSG